VDSSRTLSADVGRELLDELLAVKSLLAAEVVQVDRDADGRPRAVRVPELALRRSDDADGWIVTFPKPHVEEIEQLKNELVSTVSHELKTPLASIKAYTATLRQNPALYEAHREEFLGVVEQQADRLSRLVEDMLLVTRVESGHMLRRRVNVPVESVLDEALRELPHDPVLHPVERRIAGVELSGDPERLRDIFRNLLENAFKYSPDGGAVEVEARSEGDWTIVTIRDRGMGIEQADLPYIFDRFYRAESQQNAGIGGSGLGLYIVQALVRAHGGTIDARSEAGRGTEFTLRLPVR
jgi:signal transduction histidine kinase